MRQSLKRIVARRRGTKATVDASAIKHLAEFRVYLELGNLVICANCKNFTPTGGIETGDCRRYGQVWGTVPFWCQGFEPSATHMPCEARH
jgi:hypothetical protein